MSEPSIQSTQSLSSFSSFRALTSEQLQFVYKVHMQRDFPPAERKPLARLLALLAEGNYEPYGLFADETDQNMIAYALYWKAGDDPYVMLDYFAVLPEYRNRGEGSTLLRQMLDRFCRNGHGVFGEVEAPVSKDESVNSLRRRRLGFYDRAGLRKAGYTARVIGVPYIVLLYGPEISDDNLIKTHQKLYHSVFSDSFYAKNVEIPGAIL